MIYQFFKKKKGKKLYNKLREEKEEWKQETGRNRRRRNQ